MTNILLALFLMLPGSSSFEDDLNHVRQYLELFQSGNVPTLADLYKYDGVISDEDEEKLENVICVKNNWVPVDSNVSCINYSKARRVNIDKTPSMYLAWLKTHLPDVSSMELVNVQQYQGKDDLEHKIIVVRNNYGEMKMYATLGEESTREQFGSLFIYEINGKKVSEMFADDLKAGYQPK